MSYLDSPRLHFKGWFQADVSTINNDVRFYQNASFVPEYQQLNANNSWNPEGTGIFRFVDCAVTGGNLDGRTLTDAGQDPVIGMLLENADRRAPGKLVDLDPQQQMVSEIWGMQLRLLDAARRQLFSGEYKPGPFCNLWKRQQTGVPRDQQLAANYQSVLDAMAWDDLIDSPLLRALRDASDDDRLSIAFNVYGYGRDATIPRYTMGHVVGTIGPYRRGEPAHFVVGRQMIADPTNWPAIGTGCLYNAQGRYDAEAARLTLDLGNSFPILDANSGLLDVGPVQVGVLRTNPQAAVTTVAATDVVVIGEVPYRDADWYAQTAGVQAFDLSTQPDARDLLRDHPLVLLGPAAHAGDANVAASAGTDATTFSVRLQESIDGQYVRADQFVFRMDPGEVCELHLHASRFGMALAASQVVLSSTEGMMGGSGGGATITPTPRPAAAIPDIAVPADAFAFPGTVTTDADGRAVATLRLSEAGPGTPRGYISGQLYGVGYQLAQQPAGYLSNPLNYVSVLAYSRKDVPAIPTWYDDIQPVFAQFGNLYPIMGRYIVDLNSYESVCERIPPLTLAFSLPRADANHMPVTRDLGIGDRDTILRWLRNPGPDGRPVLGRPKVGPLPDAVAVAAAAPASPPPPDLDLLPGQGGGKTAFILQYAARRGDASEPGETS